MKLVDSFHFSSIQGEAITPNFAFPAPANDPWASSNLYSFHNPIVGVIASGKNGANFVLKDGSKSDRPLNAGKLSSYREVRIKPADAVVRQVVIFF